MSDKLIKWAAAAAIRAVKTAAQTALAAIPVGAAFGDLDWAYVASIAGVSAVASVLTSLAGLPEVDDGASIAKLARGE